VRIPRRQVMQIPVVGAVAFAAGCTLGEETPPAPDPLIELARQARFDAAQATSTVMLHPDRNTSLQLVASQRSAHADALEAEVRRLAGIVTATPTTDSHTYDVGLGEVRGSLTASARAALVQARKESGYRAGLLASISAACIVAVEVLLA
jgi:hypothetical protein